jgi:hypothetical protein
MRRRIYLLCIVLGAALTLAGCKRPDHKLAARTAAADTCRAVAKTREVCQSCCASASGGWKFSPEGGCTCLVPTRCKDGDRDLKTCGGCCDKQDHAGKVLVGPVFDPKRGCSCQYL